MAPAVRLLVAVLLLGVAFAGCTGADDEPETGTRTAPRLPSGTNPGMIPQDGEGTIVGVVLTADFDPVSGARVRLIVNGQQAAQTITNAQGAFNLADVPAGRHRLDISAGCCRDDSRPVTVEKDRTTTLSIRLEPLGATESQRPFAVPTPWEAFIACGISIGEFHESPCVLDPNDDREFAHNVTAGLRTLYVRLDWEPSTPAADEMRIRVDMGDERVLGYLEGTSPLELTIHDADIEDPEMKWSAIDSRREIFLTVAPGGLAVMFQQPVTVTMWEFYWMQAPDGFSYDPAA